MATQVVKGAFFVKVTCLQLVMILIDPAERELSPAPSEFLPDYTSEGHGNASQYPPSYNVPRPSQPLTYTFTGWQLGSMRLMPPPTAADLNPLYNVTVELNLNPFVPLSYVTTIHRGRSVQGQYVGGFELAVNQKRAVVTLGDSTTRLSNILYALDRPPRQWGWHCGDVQLRWDCRSVLEDGSPMCVCYEGAGAMSQLATFVPPPIDASPPLPPAVLTVFPDGHEYFDHILLSALIIERKRTLDA